MRSILLGLVAACAVLAQAPTPAPVSGAGPWLESSNFAWDLYGVEDHRPGCWGYGEAQTAEITFATPPPGYRVRIIHLEGDFVSWIRTLPGEPETPLESAAGVLLGLQGNDPTGSVGCDWCATQTPVYIQDQLSEKTPGSRSTYSLKNFVLGPDNQLRVVVASWLNTTGKPIHMEPTFVWEWDYVRVDQPTQVKPRIQVKGPSRIKQ